MKPICAITVSLLLWISLIRNGHAVVEPPLSVLRAEGDEGKPPLIVLTSSITKPRTSEGVKYEATQEGTASDAAAEVTAVPETPTRAPHQKKPAPNGPQGQLLSMPEMWNSLPLPNAAARPVPLPPSAIPFYYPLPVYIPYPIPFMLNNAPEEQIGVKFNELLPEHLSKERKKIRKGQHPKKTASRNLPTKWQGKVQNLKPKTTTTTTTTTAAPATTVPTKETRTLGQNIIEFSTTDGSLYQEEETTIIPNKMGLDWGSQTRELMDIL